MSTALHVYGAAATSGMADLLVWSSAPAADDYDVFLRNVADAVQALRPDLALADVLWGYSRESQYTAKKSPREMNPNSEDRSKFLSVYPFTKTHEWYQLSAADRQEVMNDHIAIGKRHGNVRQLLLYSYGLQDQDFVVAYEYDDLVAYSQLVGELRSSLGRPFTECDTPIYTGVYLRSHIGATS
ncbi:MAG: chlorite dismutase family protein [Gemmatimonadales bacterium]